MLFRLLPQKSCPFCFLAQHLETRGETYQEALRVYEPNKAADLEELGPRFPLHGVDEGKSKRITKNLQFDHVLTVAHTISLLFSL